MIQAQMIHLVIGVCRRTPQHRRCGIAVAFPLHRYPKLRRSDIVRCFQPEHDAPTALIPNGSQSYNDVTPDGVAVLRLLSLATFVQMIC